MQSDNRGISQEELHILATQAPVYSVDLHLFAMQVFGIDRRYCASSGEEEI